VEGAAVTLRARHPAGRGASAVPAVTVDSDRVLDLAHYLWGGGKVCTADLRRAAGRQVHYRGGRPAKRRWRAGGLRAYGKPLLVLGLCRLVRNQSAKQVLRSHCGCMVTKDEHQRLGRMRQHHPQLIAGAGLCLSEDIVGICLERSGRAGRVPQWRADTSSGRLGTATGWRAIRSNSSSARRCFKSVPSLRRST
jgi:hypothetical protein